MSRTLARTANYREEGMFTDRGWTVASGRSRRDINKKRRGEYPTPPSPSMCCVRRFYFLPLGSAIRMIEPVPSPATLAEVV